ncbi:MAG: hypothetical protein WDA24_07455 [Tissierellales bacterium]
MLETKIDRFILCACCEEVNRYRKDFNHHSSFEYNKNQWTYVVEIMIITIKSLVPDENKHGSVIDYKRFYEELKLWYSYRHGENNSLIGCLHNDKKTYWDNEDDSIFSRITPIIFANDDWEVARREVLKNILYTSGSITSILEGLALSRIFFVLISNSTISFDELISYVKEEIVCFSQKEFIDDHSRDIRFSLDTYEGNYSIEFERKRIELLNTLNGINIGSRYEILRESLNILGEKEGHTLPGFFFGGLRGLRTDFEYTSVKDEDFIRNLCGFLAKLRKGRITAESLLVDKYVLPDIFQYKEGELFFHSLLKKCQVIKKITEQYKIISFVRTKSGTYRFMRNK